MEFPWRKMESGLTVAVQIGVFMAVVSWRQQSGDSLTGRSERWGDAKWLVGGCYKPGAHVRDPVWARYGNGQNFQQKSIWAVKTVEARSTPGMRPVRTVRRWQRNGEKINFMHFFLRPGTSSLKTQRSGLCCFLIARQVDGRPTRQSVRAPIEKIAVRQIIVVDF